MIDEFDLEEQNNLLIVDFLNFCFRYKHKGDFNFHLKSLNEIRSFAHSFKSKDVLVLGDSKGSKYRKDLFPDYKANRVFKDEDKDDFEKFINEYYASLTFLSSYFKTYWREGVEADDLAAYACYHSPLVNHFDNIWLLSSDGDWNLLISEKIHRYSYLTRKEYKLDTWDQHNKWGFDDNLSVKVMMGDSGDNIAGITGIGPVRAQKLVEEHGDIWNILKKLPLKGSAKYIQNLNNEGPAKLPLNDKLINLKKYSPEALDKVGIRQDFNDYLEKLWI